MDNLPTVDKLPGLNLSFIERFHCTVHLMECGMKSQELQMEGWLLKLRAMTETDKSTTLWTVIQVVLSVTMPVFTLVACYSEPKHETMNSNKTWTWCLHHLILYLYSFRGITWRKVMDRFSEVDFCSVWGVRLTEQLTLHSSAQDWWR